MRRLAAAAIVASMVWPAFAQEGGGRHHGAATKKKEEPAQVKANDKDYKAALDRLPAQKYDPWGTLRPATPDKH
jgi:hypothetical protein